MTSSPPHPKHLAPAFTLVEMITVMAIITILLVFAVPATNSLLRGNDLTTGAQNLSNLLGLARQQALTQNRPIEVRLYKLADQGAGEVLTDSATWKYRAMQVFAIPDASGAIPIGSDQGVNAAGTTMSAPIPLDKIQRFPPTFIIDGGRPLSSLIGNALPQGGTSTTGAGVVLTNEQAQTRELPMVGKHYQSVAFRFYPDGSTSLGTSPDGGWFLTAHQLVAGDNLSTAPPNFATLQIDPFNGNIREFRP